jgi:2-methylcitrate synthase
MLLYWHHYARNGKRIEVDADSDSIAAHFLHLLHGKAAQRGVDRAMQVSLILYAEHEFNASTFTARVIAGTGSDLYSCIAGAIGALKGPKHGGANEVALEIQQRYDSPMKPRPTFAAASPSAKSSSASAIRSTPSAIRAATL